MPHPWMGEQRPCSELWRAMVWKMSSWSRSRQSSASTCTSNKAVLRARESTSPQARRAQLQKRSHSVHSPHTDSRLGNRCPEGILESLVSSPPGVNPSSWMWTSIVEEQLLTATSPDGEGTGLPSGRVIVCV